MGRRIQHGFSAAGSVHQTNFGVQLQLAEFADRLGVAQNHVVGTLAEMLHIDLFVRRIIADHVTARSVVRRFINRCLLYTSTYLIIGRNS